MKNLQNMPTIECLEALISRSKIICTSIMLLFVNSIALGQSWSTEYVLIGDSIAYSLSHDKILQGNSVDFFFPAYKYYQTSTRDAVESVSIGNTEIIEIEFHSERFNFRNVNFEIDIYAEAVDTLRFFLRTTDDMLILVAQQTHRNGYKYLPTVNFSANIARNDFKSIQIAGRSKNGEKIIAGRVNGSKKIQLIAESMMEVDSLLSRYTFEKHSDTFVELPDFYLRLHGFYLVPRIVLNDCHSTIDSIRCISQFTTKLLNEYGLYDVYGIDKQELINRNALLAKTANDIGSYYSGMEEIIASLNSCHMRLSTNTQDEVESPLQAIYFYNINNEIAVSAIFDPTLEDKIHLGDILLSINGIPIEQLYNNFSKNVYASSPQQREIKITQKLLYLAQESFGDSLSLEFKNNASIYYSWLNESNLSGRKVIPSDFKMVTDNTIEMYDNIMYFRPFFEGSRVIPFIYSHIADFNNCEGLILDLRGCSGGDHSFSTFFSFLISENSLIAHFDTTMFSTYSDMIVKPSTKIRVQAPIIVLVDARTTCYPEFLINSLRNEKSDIYVIGASNTAGSAQLSLMTILPRNAFLMHFEGIAKDAFGQSVDDNIGIVPDTVIHFNSYKDLFPYNDKIKHYALKYLGYSLEDNDESQF